MGNKTCCPICGKAVLSGAEEGKTNPYHPFCSERCRWVDLGKWLEGLYSLEVQNPEESDSDLPDELPGTE